MLYKALLIAKTTPNAEVLWKMFTLTVLLLQYNVTALEFLLINVQFIYWIAPATIFSPIKVLQWSTSTKY